MPRVKIVQVYNFVSSDDYYATQKDVTEITDWEEIPETDMHNLREALRKKNTNLHGSYKNDTPYGLLIIPEEPVSAIESVRQLVEQYKRDAEKIETARKAARERAEATKMDRKRKQLEKLKKELGE